VIFDAHLDIITDKYELVPLKIGLMTPLVITIYLL